MMNLGVATNLTADEAQQSLQDLLIANMPIKDVDRLGSTVVALVTVRTTTEKKLLKWHNV